MPKSSGCSSIAVSTSRTAACSVAISCTAEGAAEGARAAPTAMNAGCRWLMDAPALMAVISAAVAVAAAMQAVRAAANAMVE